MSWVGLGHRKWTHGHLYGAMLQRCVCIAAWSSLLEGDDVICKQVAQCHIYYSDPPTVITFYRMMLYNRGITYASATYTRRAGEAVKQVIVFHPVRRCVCVCVFAQ